MADNVQTTTDVSTLPDDTIIGARSVSYSGDSNVLIAPVGLVAFAGSDDAKTVTDIPGDNINGLDVDVTRVGGNVATTVADGADVTLGAKADAAATTDAGTFSLMGLFKRLLEKFTTQFPAALSNGFFKVSLQETSVTQPVSDASGSLTVDNATLSVTGGGVEASALRVTLASDSTGLVSIDDNGGSVTIDAASLPLPTGASTLSEQQTQTTALQLIDDTVATDGAATPTKGILIAGQDGTNAQTIKTDTSGELQVDVLSSALPTGASTAANQSTANTALSAIQTAVELIDNAVAGNELQVDVITMPTVTVTVSGSVDTELTTADLDTGAGTDTRAVVGLVGSASGGGALIPGSATDGLLVNLGANNDVTVTGSVTANAGTNLNTSALALETGGNLAGAATSLALIDDTIATDGAATPTKGVLIAGQDGTNAQTIKTDTSGELQIDVLTVPAPLSTTGGGTEATALRVTIASDSTGVVSVDDNGGSLTIDAASLPLPTGAATLAEQQTQTTALTDTIGAAYSAEDIASLHGDKGVVILARRTDTPANTSGTDLDYEVPQMSAGRLWTSATVTSIAAGDSNIGNVDIVTVPAPLSTTGGGTEATALRVTLATDSTGLVSVDDNGGSLTVDAASLPLPTGAATLAEQQTQTTALQIIDNFISGSRGLVTEDNSAAIKTSVELIDDTIATLGTTTYTEATTKGAIVGAVRRDADTTLVDTTNEVGPLQMDANGRLKVEAFSGETLPVSLTSTTVTGTVAVTQSGTWDEVGINDSGNSITVDNGGTFATQVDGAALTALQLIDDAVYAEDVAAQAADKGIAVLAVRRDADTTLVGADNDYANLQVDANGYLKVEVFDGGGSHTVDNAGTFAVQVDGSALTALQLIDNTILVDDAAFTPATSSVSMAGFQADETTTDSVDEGDAGAARMTLDRKVIVTPQPHTSGGLSVFNATSSDGATALTSTAQAIKASAGKVYGWYIYNPNSTAQFVQLYNTAAASVTVGTTNPLFMLTLPATAAANVEFSMGIEFTNAGFSCAATSTAGGNGAPTTALDAVIFYK